MSTETVYRSDTRPDFAPFEEDLGSITGFGYTGDLSSEVSRGLARQGRRRSACSTTCWPSARWRR